MGRNKALLPFGPRTIIETVIERLGQVCDDLLLVTNSPEPYRHLELRTVPDALPWGDWLAGAYTGLLHASGPVFVSSYDMPFLEPSLVRHMATLVQDADAVVPRHGGSYKPVHAVYTRACLDPMLECLWRYGPATDFLHDVRVRVVEDDEMRQFDPSLRSTVDVDTPEDYADALRHLPGLSRR
jgi:molybdopterin-guanine dinucleotide biosynthesis protein A